MSETEIASLSPSLPQRELRNRHGMRSAHRPRPAFAASARGVEKHEMRLQREREANEAFSRANEALSKMPSSKRKGSSSQSSRQDSSQSHGEAHTLTHEMGEQSQRRLSRPETPEATISPPRSERSNTHKRAKIACPTALDPVQADNVDDLLEAEFDDDQYWDEADELDWDSVVDTSAPVFVPPRSSPDCLFRWAGQKKTVKTVNTDRAARMFDDLFAAAEEEEEGTQAPVRPPLQILRNNDCQSPSILQSPSRPGLTPLRKASGSQSRLGSTVRLLGTPHSVQSAGKSRTPFKSTAITSSTPFRQRVSNSTFRSPFKNGRPSANLTATSSQFSQKPGPTPATAQPIYASQDSRKTARRSLRELSLLESWSWRGKTTEDDPAREDIMEILHDPHSARRYMFASGTEGVEEARMKLAQLAKCDVKLVKDDWVRNHYGLIVWKLAGLAFHSSEQAVRFRWEEVVRQLTYRYEREINRNERSAVKRIQEGDSPAALPMVLCVYDISYDDDDSCPSVTLTDGWYRMQTHIDASIQRAIAKGKIRVGSKLSISNAAVDTDRVANEPLEVFLTSLLTINGNACKLATWDAKLGFSKGLFVSSLRSLTGDGGSVPVMDVVIIRAYPKGFTDDVRNSSASGSVQISSSPSRMSERILPSTWGEEEEEEKREEWRRKYEMALEGVETMLGKKMRKLNEVIELLDDACRSDGVDPSSLPFPTPDVTGHLAAMLESNDPRKYLRVKDVLSTLLWEARKELEKITQNLTEEKVDLLNKQCPPREVRSFQVLRVRDTRMAMKGQTSTASGILSERLARCKRDALVRVWDAAELDEEHCLHQGHRYRVVNLMPHRQKSWPKGIDDDDEIYLTTRKDTKWIELPLP